MEHKENVGCEELELQFDAIFKMSPMGIAFHEMIFDETGNPFDYRFVGVNEHFIELVGSNPTQKTAREAFPGIENDPAQWIQKYGSVVKTGESIHFEQYFQLNNRWYDCIAYRYKPNHFAVLFSETTKHKQEIIELTKLRNAIQRSGDAIFLTDKEGTITYINPAFTTMYGYTENEVVGKVTPRIIKSGLVPQEHYTEFWGVLLEKHELHGEIQNKRKDGTLIDIEGSANAILDDGGNIVGFLGIQHDITKRKATEKKLAESLENAEKMNKLIVGRETKMIELKEENEALKKQIEELKK